MIKNIRHDTLIVHPLLIAAETIDLNRQSTFSGLQMSDHISHVMIDHGMPLEIVPGILPKDPNIRHPSSINEDRLINTMFLVIVIDLFLAMLDIVLYQLDL